MALDFAAAYDDLNPDDHDYRFYAALADELRATRVIDLGCGTGTLTRTLASRSRTAVGIDPDPEMLRVARQKPGGERVDWRLGFSDYAGTNASDFAVMSGHVAQVFRDDGAWSRALQDLHRALVPNGALAFESRNPAARTWERWTRQATLRTLDTPRRAVSMGWWSAAPEFRLSAVAQEICRHSTVGRVTRGTTPITRATHPTKPPDHTSEFLVPAKTANPAASTLLE